MSDFLSKILIIEDEQDIRDMYKIAFEKHRFLVEAVFEYSQIFSTLENFRPDVILVDIMLPWINWFDLLKEIKSRIPDIYFENSPKIIMFSNIDSEMYTRRWFDFWFDDYVIKADITPAYLIKKVKKLLWLEQHTCELMQNLKEKYPIYTGDDNVVLRKKSIKIEKITDDIKILANDLLYLLWFYNWVWLAAPQVWKNIQMLAFSRWNVMSWGNRKVLLENDIMINPEIYYMSKDTISFNEWCLSLPWFYGNVERSNVIKVKYQDKNWEFRDETFEWFNAVIVQHEIDHLNWVLFSDKVSK